MLGILFWRSVPISLLYDLEFTIRSIWKFIFITQSISFPLFFLSIGKTYSCSLDRRSITLFEFIILYSSFQGDLSNSKPFVLPLWWPYESIQRWHQIHSQIYSQTCFYLIRIVFLFLFLLSIEQHNNYMIIYMKTQAPMNVDCSWLIFLIYCHPPSFPNHSIRIFLISSVIL